MENYGVAPGTRKMTSGGSSNDCFFTGKGRHPRLVSEGGSGVWFSDLNGGSALGSAHVLTGADITAGFVNLQTGTLSNGSTYTITAKVTDVAGKIGRASCRERG